MFELVYIGGSRISQIYIGNVKINYNELMEGIYLKLIINIDNDGGVVF